MMMGQSELSPTIVAIVDDWDTDILIYIRNRMWIIAWTSIKIRVRIRLRAFFFWVTYHLISMANHCRSQLWYTTYLMACRWFSWFSRDFGEAVLNVSKVKFQEHFRAEINWFPRFLIPLSLLAPPNESNRHSQSIGNLLLTIS